MRQAVPQVEVSEAQSESNGAGSGVGVYCNIRQQSCCGLWKYLYSTLLTMSSLGFVGWAIANGFSSFPAHIAVQFVILALASLLVFYLEGIKVAVVLTATQSPSAGDALPLREIGSEAIEEGLAPTVTNPPDSPRWRQIVDLLLHRKCSWRFDTLQVYDVVWIDSLGFNF